MTQAVDTVVLKAPEVTKKSLDKVIITDDQMFESLPIMLYLGAHYHLLYSPVFHREMTESSRLMTMLYSVGGIIITLVLIALVIMTRRHVPKVC